MKKLNRILKKSFLILSDILSKLHENNIDFNFDFNFNNPPFGHELIARVEVCSTAVNKFKLIKELSLHSYNLKLYKLSFQYSSAYFN